MFWLATAIGVYFGAGTGVAAVQAMCPDTSNGDLLRTLLLWPAFFFRGEP